MGIIGVVAALTIPNLNSSTNYKEKVAKVMKLYSNLQDAYGRAEAVYGPIDEWYVNDNDNKTWDTRMGERFTEFMKISKNCGYSATSNTSCWKSATFNWGTYSFITADGASMSLITWGIVVGTEDSSSYYSGRILGFAFVDLDGPSKGKNQPGIDQFNFEVLDSGIYPEGMNTTGGACYNYGNTYCTRWVVEKGNMDYLKTKDGGKTCPNGKILDWTTNTSCK